MKNAIEVRAMLDKICSIEGTVDGRGELIMALEWVLDEGVSTSIGLESVVEEDVVEEEEEVAQ